MELSQTIRVSGHEHVQATHGSTLEVTSDDWLTPAGDCILAVEADTVPQEFDSEYKHACQDATATVRADIQVITDDGSLHTTIEGRGDPELTFDDDRSAVIRTSEFVDDRTVMIDADAAATDIGRDLVSALSEGAAATLVLSVEQ